MGRWRHCAKSIALLSLMALFLSLHAPAKGQSGVREGDGKKSSDGTELQDAVRWRLLLDQLNDQAYLLPLDKNRPYGIVQVADAYWNLDKAKSEEIFKSALEAAMALKAGSRDQNEAIRHVLAMAAKRDVNIAKRLTERVAEKRSKENGKSNESVNAAIDLLRSGVDRNLVVQLAEAGAPNGLSDDSAGVLILELAAEDLGAAKRVYLSYLNKFAANPALPLNELLWLGGYPFGYGESYGFYGSNLSRILGFGGRLVPGLTPDSALARTFLDVALRDGLRNLDHASSLPANQADILNALVLFTATYLSAEVPRYRPEDVGAWRLLFQRALSGATAARQQEVERNMEFVRKNRAVAEKRDRSPEVSLQDTVETRIEKAKKLPEGCERDRSYADAAIAILSLKDYTRALSTASLIQETSFQDSVYQFIYYDMSSAAAELGQLADAEEYAKRVPAPGQRALLYVKIARAALRQEDRVRAAGLLAQTIRLGESSSDRQTQASILLAAAAAFAQFDPIETVQTLKDAIQAAEGIEEANLDSFAVLRKVDLSCFGGPGRRQFMSGERAEQFSLYDTLASVALTDLEGAILLANGIAGPLARIRALATIVRVATKGRKF